MAYPRHLKDPEAHKEVLQLLRSDIDKSLEENLQPATTTKAGLVMLADQKTAKELKDDQKALTAKSIEPLISGIKRELAKGCGLFQREILFEESGEWIVLQGVHLIFALLKGGDGGTGGSGGWGQGYPATAPSFGGGGELVGTLITVDPGTTLQVRIGAAGANGGSGGNAHNSTRGPAAGGGGGAGGGNTSILLGKQELIRAIGGSGGGGGAGAGGTGAPVSSPGKGGDGGAPGGFAGSTGGAGSWLPPGQGGAGIAGRVGTLYGGGQGSYWLTSASVVIPASIGLGNPCIYGEASNGYIKIYY